MSGQVHGKQIKAHTINHLKIDLAVGDLSPSFYTYASNSLALGDQLRVGQVYADTNNVLKVVYYEPLIYVGSTINNSIPLQVENLTDFSQQVTQGDSYTITTNIVNGVLYILVPDTREVVSYTVDGVTFPMNDDVWKKLDNTLTVNRDNTIYNIYKGELVNFQGVLSFNETNITPNIPTFIYGTTGNDGVLTSSNFNYLSKTSTTGQNVSVDFSSYTEPSRLWYLEPLTEPIKTRWYVNPLNNEIINETSNNTWRLYSENFTIDNVEYRVYGTTFVTQYNNIEFRLS